MCSQKSIQKIKCLRAHIFIHLNTTPYTVQDQYNGGSGFTSNLPKRRCSESQAKGIITVASLSLRASAQCFINDQRLCISPQWRANLPTSALSTFYRSAIERKPSWPTASLSTLAWQMFSCRQEGTTGGGENCRKDHQITPSCHSGPVQHCEKGKLMAQWLLERSVSMSPLYRIL